MSALRPIADMRADINFRRSCVEKLESNAIAKKAL
jgi:hypothetical protein